MPISISKDSLYMRDPKTGEFIPVSMYNSGANETLEKIAEIAEAKKMEASEAMEARKAELVESMQDDADEIKAQIVAGAEVDIETKKNQVLEQIPDDYTELSESVNQVKDDIGDLADLEFDAETVVDGLNKAYRHGDGGSSENPVYDAVVSNMITTQTNSETAYIKDVPSDSVTVATVNSADDAISSITSCGINIFDKSATPSGMQDNNNYMGLSFEDKIAVGETMSARLHLKEGKTIPSSGSFGLFYNSGAASWMIHSGSFKDIWFQTEYISGFASKEREESSTVFGLYISKFY